MELTARGLAVRVRSAYAQAAGRSQVLVAPSAGELPACARRPAPFPLQTRIPAVSARIAPPWLSSPSRPSCLISRMPGISGVGQFRASLVGHFRASKSPSVPTTVAGIYYEAGCILARCLNFGVHLI